MQAKRQAAWDRFKARPASVRRPERQQHLDQLMDDAATSIKDRDSSSSVIDLEERLKQSLRGEEGR
jgi:hypothetical protein